MISHPIEIDCSPAQLPAADEAGMGGGEGRRAGCALVDRKGIHGDASRSIEPIDEMSDLDSIHGVGRIEEDEVEAPSR